MVRPFVCVLMAVLLGAAALSGCSSGDRSDLESELGLNGGAEEWMESPVVPDLDEETAAQLIADVRASLAAGNRGGVFAKIGDSNSDFSQNLYGLGCREVTFGPHRNLVPTHRRYAGTEIGDLDTEPGCVPANSFTRDSIAAVVGAWVEWVMTPVGKLRQSTDLPLAADECRPRETPLSCELRLMRPRYATIMIGSNDVYRDLPLGGDFEDSLTGVIETVREFGAVPVISTIAPMTRAIDDADERVDEVNEIITELADDMNVPLINLWRAMNEPEMIDHGLGRDGVHFNVLGGESSPQVLRNSVVLTDEATRFGANRRNLIWLQTLDLLDRTVARITAAD